MSVFFIADTHFDHGNIIKYCNRLKFVNQEELSLIDLINQGKLDSYNLKISNDSIEKMNTYIIDQINNTVGVNDILWHCGDVFWHSNKISNHENYLRAQSIRNRIKCKNINLVFGNHDEKYIANLFSNTYNQTEIVVDRQSITLNHYPMRAWNKSHRGSWMLYGHVHGMYYDQDLTNPIKSLDVGVDTHDFKPWSMQEIKELMDKKPKANSFQSNNKSQIK